MSDLLSVLKALDPTDDSLWTDDGLPAMEAVKSLAGEAVSREDINKVALGLTRNNVRDYVPLAKESKKAKKADVLVETEEPVNQDTVYAEIDKARQVLAEKLQQRQLAEQEVEEADRVLKDLERQVIHVESVKDEVAEQALYLAALERDREERILKMKKLEESGLTALEIKEMLGLNKRKR